MSVKDIFILSGIEEEKSIELSELCYEISKVQIIDPAEIAYEIVKIINAT